MDIKAHKFADFMQGISIGRNASASLRLDDLIVRLQHSCSNIFSDIQREQKDFGMSQI